MEDGPDQKHPSNRGIYSTYCTLDGKETPTLGLGDEYFL